MKHLTLNKNLWKLMVLMTWKNKKLTKKLRKEGKKRSEIAEKQILKTKKMLDEEKIEEKELWGKLNELNKEFWTINNIKKKQKNV